MKSRASTVATGTFMCGPVGAPDAVHGRADCRYHLAVNRSVDRRQRGPLPVGDVVHLDGGQHARRFLATDGDDPAIDERGAVAPAWSRHVRELLPVSGYRVEALEGRRVLVGGQIPPAHGVHVDAVRHCSQVLTRGRQIGCLRPGLPVEHLGLRDEFLVVLSADDHELVADDRCCRRRAGMLEGRKVYPLAVAEREDLVRRVGEVVAGAPDDAPSHRGRLPPSRDAGESAAEAASCHAPVLVL